MIRRSTRKDATSWRSILITLPGGNPFCASHFALCQRSPSLEPPLRANTASPKRAYQASCTTNTLENAAARLETWPPIERVTARSPAEAGRNFQLSGRSTIGWVLLISINPSLLRRRCPGILLQSYLARKRPSTFLYLFMTRTEGISPWKSNKDAVSASCILPGRAPIRKFG